jgi:hypothetical protein
LWEKILSSLYESAHRVAYQSLDPVNRQKILESHINQIHIAALNLPKLMSNVRTPRSALSTLGSRDKELTKLIGEFLRDWSNKNGERSINSKQDGVSVNQFIESLRQHEFQVDQAIVRQHIADIIYRGNNSITSKKRSASNENIAKVLSDYTRHLHEFTDISEDVVIDDYNAYRLLAPAEFPSNRCENPKVVDIHTGGHAIAKSHNPSMAKVLHDAIQSEANPETGKYEYSYAMKKLLIKKFKEIDTEPPFGLIDKEEFQNFVKRWQGDHSIPESPNDEIDAVFDKIDENSDNWLTRDEILNVKPSELKNILRLSEEGNCRTCTFDRHEDCLRTEGHLNVISKYRPTSCEMRLDISSLGCGFRITLYAPLKQNNSFHIQNIEMSKEMKHQFVLLLKSKNVNDETIKKITGGNKFFRDLDTPPPDELRVNISFPKDGDVDIKSSEDIWFRAGYQAKMQFTNKKKTKKNTYELKYNIVTEILDNIGRCCNPIRFKQIEGLFLTKTTSSISEINDEPWPIMYATSDIDTIQQFKQIIRQTPRPFPCPILEIDEPHTFSAIIDPLAIWR